MRIMRSFVIVFGWIWLTPLCLFAQPKQPEYLGTARPKSIPRRVVSLAPNLTEILFALGVGDALVGVTRFDDYPEEVKRLPKVGGFIDPSLEAILTLKPDLVVCTPNPGGRHRLEALTKMELPILVLPEYSLDDIYLAIRTLGELFQKTEPACQLIDSLQKKIGKVSKAINHIQKPAVLLVYGHKPLVAAGEGSFGDSMLELAGGENVLKNSKVRYPLVPMEEVYRLQPEVIIDASSSGAGAEMTAQEIQRTWGRYKNLKAVMSGRVYIFDSALWFRPGPRIAEGIEKLSQILHPDMYKN